MDELFSLFWVNTKLSAATAPAFQRRIENHSGNEHFQGTAQYAAVDTPLPLGRGSPNRLMDLRRSGRTFSKKPLTLQQLGAICTGFRSTPSGLRPYPSAGATYAVEVFWLLNRFTGSLQQSAVHYNPDNHSISRIGDIPPWAEIAPLVNLDTAGTIPQAMAIFVIFPERVMEKYGDRGGRFALMEVGHMAQNLALSLAANRLGGVEAGGLLDDEMSALLGLEGTTAQIALGFLCGSTAQVDSGSRSRPIQRLIERLR
jgi:SagB-type dehydrogenase family enzyme